jgi:proteasome lid subunit RPN8/RPN11
MQGWKIKKSLLSDVMMAARHVYPNEFIAMLGVSPHDPFLVSEFVVIPAEYGRVHSQLRTDLIPLDDLIVGTVHSHPSPSVQSSSADKNAFARLGTIHLILGYPYALSLFRAYGSDGKPLPVVVVE